MAGMQGCDHDSKQTIITITITTTTTTATTNILTLALIIIHWLHRVCAREAGDGHYPVCLACRLVPQPKDRLEELVRRLKRLEERSEDDKDTDGGSLAAGLRPRQRVRARARARGSGTRLWRPCLSPRLQTIVPPRDIRSPPPGHSCPPSSLPYSTRPLFLSAKQAG